MLTCILETSEAKTRGVVMIEQMVEWAGQASTAWWVLGVATVVILVESARTSKKTLWGDMLEEDE